MFLEMCAVIEILKMGIEKTFYHPSKKTPSIYVQGGEWLAMASSKKGGCL